MNKPRLCPDCQAKGNFNFMLYSPKNRRYICPKCTGVWTPKLRDDDRAAKLVEDEIGGLMTQLYPANLPAKDPIPAGEALKGGGGSKSKAGGKKPVKKKSLNQLYREL